MPPPVSSQPSYAGFWIRLLAFIIDIVILGIVVGVPLNFVFGSGVVSSIQSGDLATAQRLSNMQSWITGIIQLAYFISLTTIFGGTLGKLVLGLRVVDANGQKINIVKAILREFIGKILSFLTLLLGFIMVGFDSKKQGLHDKIAGTYVVKVR
ncbi:MAG: hypothetical protein A2126_00635 [Candidatus Woykebacteria bacterium GWB1_45_5]|uniref:RDD domain-containing protein n=2 Tax=Candidatus Woykeibacteriota TaxID=1817899 RepID=A0A1G1W2U6_9BACT|nr:MAG: hypothetical protein A2113_00915 [Candidatus Woykebacteria bacterium GWA1_44_8]OGY24244.1 MAG: hypothetical protein A2126_00635 [Candidatus Woykebacteria bacterium GWB1_45_5]